MIGSPRIPQIDLLGVASRVEAVRQVAALNRELFARSFGLDPSSYTKIIKGEKPLKSEHAFAIAEQWGVSMDFLYRGDLSQLGANMRASVIDALNNPQA